MIDRRLTPLLLLLLPTVACGGGGDDAAPPPVAEVQRTPQPPEDADARVTAAVALPEVAHVDPPVRGPEPRLALNVTADGQLLVDRFDKAFGNERLLEALRWEEGERLETISLDEWKTILELGRRQWRDPETEHSLVRVALRLDRAAPLLWLQTIMVVCAEARTGRLELAVEGPDGSEGRLAVPLPSDRGLADTGRGEREAAGPGTPPAPGVARLSLVWVEQDEGERLVVAHEIDVDWEVGDDDGWAAARERIDGAVLERGPAAQATLTAPPTWPVGRAARVVATLRERGTTRIQLPAPPPPTAEQRKSDRLPALD